MENKTSPPAHTSSRRALVKGMAWAAPAAVASTVAPAYAVSAEECIAQGTSEVQRTFAFAGSIDNWEQTLDSSDAPAIEYRQVFNILSEVAVLATDPLPNIASTSTLQSPVACLNPGTYEMAFNTRLFGGNPRELRFRADVVALESGAVISNTFEFTTADEDFSSRPGGLRFSLSQRGQVRIRYRWTLTAEGEGAADQVAVRAPVVGQIA